MTKANTKDGCAVFFHGSSDIVDSLGHHSWIARTVGDEKTIIVLASKGWEIVVPGAYQNLNATLDQASQLVELKTDIQGQDADRAARWMLEGVGRLRRV
jgi:hypothetical protein